MLAALQLRDSNDYSAVFEARIPKTFFVDAEHSPPRCALCGRMIFKSIFTPNRASDEGRFVVESSWRRVLFFNVTDSISRRILSDASRMKPRMGRTRSDRMLARKTPFGEFMTERSDIPTFFEPLGGNNGDRLIRMGAEHLFGKLGTRLVSSPEESRLIFINGGGGMNDIWPKGLEKFHSLRSMHPDTEIVVGPSSFYFTRTNFAELIAAGNAPVTVFCRERESERLLHRILPTGIADLRLSHDLAFELIDSDVIRKLKQEATESHVLVALRGDREGLAGSRRGNIAARLPAIIRAPLKRLHRLHRRRQGASLVERLIAEREQAASLPIVNADVSTAVSFDRFVELIKSSALIITDRLHVSILGCLLDRRVSLLPGSYHKNRGVFELSMADQAHVQLAAPQTSSGPSSAHSL